MQATTEAPTTTEAVTTTEILTTTEALTTTETLTTTEALTTTQITPSCTFETWQIDNSCQFSCDPINFPENTEKFTNHIQNSDFFGFFNSFSQITLSNNLCLFSYSSVNKIEARSCEKNSKFEWAATQFGQIFYKSKLANKCWSVGFDNKITGQTCDQSDESQRFYFKNHEIRQKLEDGHELCAVVPSWKGATLRMKACFGVTVRSKKIFFKNFQ